MCVTKGRYISKNAKYEFCRTVHFWVTSHFCVISVVKNCHLTERILNKSWWYVNWGIMERLRTYWAKLEMYVLGWLHSLYNSSNHVNSSFVRAGFCDKKQFDMWLYSVQNCDHQWQLVVILDGLWYALWNLADYISTAELPQDTSFSFMYHFTITILFTKTQLQST